MSVRLSAAVTLGLLFFLSAGLNEQVAEGCTCLQRHPQRVFCESDIVIRVKVIGNVASTLPNLVAYNIKVITTYKPSNKKDFQIIYSTKICGAHLENGEYLLSGSRTLADAVFKKAGSEKRGFSKNLDAEPDSKAWILKFMSESKD